jgi:DNA mismatch endonuclease (patch repair protein)
LVDIVDKQTRSRMMAGIKGANTKPEMSMRRALHRLGYRYRLHASDLPGRPDMVFPKHKAVVFVHGCFWHRHENCRYATTPATRPEFWEKKFAENVARDERCISRLKEMGWNTLVVWECEIKSDGAASIAGKVADWLRCLCPHG